ncbi:MAG: prepilin-type N-terminal cleavage/methylation domain-containing protein [Desulfobacterales bacterium]|nr:prepilin-type N-terminal cleavage/methylation domain-containing protein [Desulfobacterales bacterium]
MGRIARTLHNQDGLTLVEMSIAMAIIAIGMLAVAAMQFWTSRSNTDGNIYTQANMLAMSQLEILKNQDVSFLLPGSYTEADTVDENGDPGGIYTRRWTIADIGTNARALTVTVEWTRLGRTRSVQVTSNTRGNGV